MSKGEETLKSLNGAYAKYVIMNVDDADSVNTAFNWFNEIRAEPIISYINNAIVRKIT